MAITPHGKNRIMIFGPTDDGTYVVEFRTAEGDVLAISIPRTETPLFDKRSREAALMGFGLATATAERIVAAERTMEVAYSTSRSPRRGGGC